ncbi:elongation factor P maturation arginine rhamnosyltransferase EarP [Ottowia sp.]|uniref:elongation factor P maturation arginine rhamnosyltransferase EarP n=1 Tax=Ottowia sp. TaxID=1898956 RepID=UPI003A899D0B
MAHHHPRLLWDVFCRVVDNLGDAGVCWRLARQLAAHGHQVRLWIDDPTPLAWMALGALQGRVAGITVIPWTQPLDAALLARLPPADVWIEAFGCEIAPEFIAAHADFTSAKNQFETPISPVWINLEYLSAESYVERMHGLPSPVLHGPAAGRTKWFFYPGFTPRTGGLLRGRHALPETTGFDRHTWFQTHGLHWHGERAVSMFCYDPPALAHLLTRWQLAPTLTRLLVAAGGSADAVQRALPPTEAPASTQRQLGALTVDFLSYLPQPEFDQMMAACDLNFVRGEDSLVRALWAGAPLVWHIYPQHDNAHHAKLQAFLDWLDAPPSLRQFHRVWNGIDRSPLPKIDLPAWRSCVLRARQRLLAQPDLCTQLIKFVSEKRYNSRLCEPRPAS